MADCASILSEIKTDESVFIVLLDVVRIYNSISGQRHESYSYPCLITMNEDKATKFMEAYLTIAKKHLANGAYMFVDNDKQREMIRFGAKANDGTLCIYTVRKYDYYLDFALSEF